MDEAWVRPKAREGLLASDHSKRGRRFVTILDPASQQVTLLEPWEHAVLVLCDGTRAIDGIVELLGPAIDGQSVDREVVLRCLKFFERHSLTLDAGLRESTDRPPGPKTMAELQQAYREWHKEPYQTGEYPELLPPPFPGTGIRLAPGLDPTVALPDGGRRAGTIGIGSTIVLAGSESLLARAQEPETDALVQTATPARGTAPASARREMIDVLEAVESAVAEAEAVDARGRNGVTQPPRVELVHRVKNPRLEPDEALRPTMVGVPAVREPRWQDDAETHAEVPAYEARTTRTRYPREGAKTRSKSPDADTDLSQVVPSDPYDDAEDTAGSRRATERSRAISTGVRPPAGAAIFERLRRVAQEAGRRASVADVIAALDADEAKRVLTHFKYLRERVRRSRSLATLASAIESLVEPRNAQTDAGPTNVLFATSLAAAIEEAVVHGRCPSCLARQAAKFDRCKPCGYQPPRKRK